MSAFAAGGAGFLLAVLWMDLMFDVQVRGAVDGPDTGLASIQAYYARVTTAARPMNRLIGAAMLATLAAIVVEIAQGTGPAWLPWLSLGLAGTAVGLAAARTVPAAMRLGAGSESRETNLALARAVLGQHLYCFAAVACLLAIQLGWG